MAMAGRIVAPSLASDEMLGIKSSGSSGGNVATVSIPRPQLSQLQSLPSSLHFLETLIFRRPRAALVHARAHNTAHA